MCIAKSKGWLLLWWWCVREKGVFLTSRKPDIPGVYIGSVEGIAVVLLHEDLQT